MAVCFQNLTLGELSSRSALSVLVGALFGKFDIFLNTPRSCYLKFGQQLFFSLDLVLIPKRLLATVRHQEVSYSGTVV
jgi:hypothetical protein